MRLEDEVVVYRERRPHANLLAPDPHHITILVLSLEDRDRVFGRLYRTDASRSRHHGGTGLGLAIARAIAERHGGTLDLVGGDHGAHLVLRLRVDGGATGC